ncbi:proline-rich protein 2-like [Equus przewalskii]|uniref:Proline-rich protein 2-like n=1 Tax=Equus przewalskii TaxID=9798 RepID=A0ABM4KPJ8_EQUPR
MPGAWRGFGDTPPAWRAPGTPLTTEEGPRKNGGTQGSAAETPALSGRGARSPPSVRPRPGAPRPPHWQAPDSLIRGVSRSRRLAGRRGACGPRPPASWTRGGICGRRAEAAPPGPTLRPAAPPQRSPPAGRRPVPWPGPLLAGPAPGRRSSTEDAEAAADGAAGAAPPALPGRRAAFPPRPQWPACHGPASRTPIPEETAQDARAHSAWAAGLEAVGGWRPELVPAEPGATGAHAPRRPAPGLREP